MQTFQIKLPQFEGPFDLLLFFIERDELNIYDIPISRITEEFLGYIKQMELLNIELASEFILVASTLMRIKSRMLIPRKELNEAGEEIDPREELVQKLLEYKKFKEASDELQSLADKRALQHKRGGTVKDLRQIAEKYSSESELHSLTLYKMLKAFNKVLERYEYEQNKPVHTIMEPPYTIEDSKQKILSILSDKKEIKFEALFDFCESRIHAVFIFLSLLELVQIQTLSLKLGNGLNNFWISLS
ncbi:MAG: segregation/condensation protein A [Chitinophagales bacterium]|nr:segregation/condensation protein A [Chitinophagales bacterium]